MHCLVWFLRRMKKKDRQPIASIPRTAPGTGPRQRPRTQVVEPLSEKDFKEDEMYHHAHCARVVAEMVRPSVPMPEYGGFNYENMRIAGLARHIQTRIYLHSCSPVYCLKGRNSCRFFFPWPFQPQQQHDENTERVALQRRLEPDDC